MKRPVETPLAGTSDESGRPRWIELPEADEQPTLDALLTNLGLDVVEVVASPRGLDVAVGDPVIYDSTEHFAIAPGAIVLAVGTEPGTSQSLKLLKEAGRAGAAAVVFKRSEEVADLADQAAALGVALLSVPEEMTWTQLLAFLQSVGRFSAQASAGGGMAGVPLGDLFALANAIAGMVGGATTIEDPARRVLAYSTLDDQPIDAGRRRSILGRQVPDSPAMRSLYRQMVETPGVLTVSRAELSDHFKSGSSDLQDLEPRSAVAIRAGRQTIGSIWVIHTEGWLDGESERALAEAARIAVPHMIQARAARDVERRLRAEMLIAVIEGRASADETVGRLGFTSSLPFSVLAFRPCGDAPVDELQFERVVDLVLVYGEASFRKTAAVAIRQTIFAVLQAERPIESARLLGIAESVRANAESRLGVSLQAAAGSTAESARDISRSRREAEYALDVLGHDPTGRAVASIDDLRNQVVLLQLRELSVEHPSLSRGKLERVLAHDADKRTAYVPTLRAYLDALGDVPSAAQQLSVHPNTFRYRLRRLGEIFDLDLSDPDERLVMGLQLRLLADDSTS